MKKLIGIAAVLLVSVLVIIVATASVQRDDERSRTYGIAKVQRGNLLVSIDATGTIEPEEVIDVGAQVAGKIVSFGTDARGRIVDYGSIVEAGMVLARIDDSLYAAEAAQADAQLQAARADVQRAEADRAQLGSKLSQALADWNRAQKLGPSEALAQSSYDAYRAAYETAKANVSIGDAAILQARAAVAQADAARLRTQRNLGYCTIVSPVNGIIIDRRVNAGQTVVSSMSAPSLFLIAKDLKRMQVWVPVNEADIGQIEASQPVTFTVDAFPDEVFNGKVGKVRLNASLTQNVVTYTVEVTTDNSSGRLIPYLSANVKFEVARSENALLVPTSALRWTPSADQVAPELRKDSGSTSGREDSTSTNGVIWVPRGPYVGPVSVRTGLSDGSWTVVEGIPEGMEIITGLATQNTEASTMTNPFVPKVPRGAGPPPGGPR